MSGNNRDGDVKYIVSGRRVEHLDAEGATLEEAIAAFKVAHPGIMPDSWEKDDADPDAFGGFVGACEGCEALIRDDDEYATADPEDGVYLCMRCVAGEAP